MEGGPVIIDDQMTENACEPNLDAARPLGTGSRLVKGQKCHGDESAEAEGMLAGRALVIIRGLTSCRVNQKVNLVIRAFLLIKWQQLKSKWEGSRGRCRLFMLQGRSRQRQRINPWESVRCLCMYISLLRLGVMLKSEMH